MTNPTNPAASSALWTGWTGEDVRSLLGRSNAHVRRGLCAIYEAQTCDEQATATTRYRNCVGFSASDARRGTQLARLVRGGWGFSPAVNTEALRLTTRYRRQLAARANRRVVDAVSSAFGSLAQ